ncbi:hypothetical protein, partial [Klebsiella michiganensis]|uniref:hypothetical protein n=1 Tax=Klebsiella michiganensis TaxID=1134687 RepID=UPI001CA308CA
MNTTRVMSVGACSPGGTRHHNQYKQRNSSGRLASAGLFFGQKKSPHGFMQARQLHLDFVPVYVFLS